MEKSQRLIALIMTINRKRKFKVKDLAQEFGVSQRTILRDMQELSEIGVPLYSEVGPHGGYQVLDDSILPPITFTEEEAVGMFFAYQSLQMYNALPFDSQLISALKKFYYQCPESTKERIDKMKSRILFWIPKAPLAVPYLRCLLDAAIEQKVISIQYHSKEGINERDIQPVGIYTANGLWYCPAYCYKSQQNRLFRVDRIVSCTIQTNQAQKLDNKLTLQDWFSLNMTEGDQLNLCAKFTPHGIRRFESQNWKIDELHILDDGTGILAIKINEKDIAFYAHYFLGFGADAVVVAPERLREAIRVELERIKVFYE